jgi:hypothetical protein
VTDDATLAGYLAKHRRPPAFSGPDGAAYSVDVLVDDAPDATGRFGAGLLFVRWSADGTAPNGHVESAYLAFGPTPDEAKRALQSLTLHDVKAELDRAVAAQTERPDW